MLHNKSTTNGKRYYIICNQHLVFRMSRAMREPVSNLERADIKLSLNYTTPAQLGIYVYFDGNAHRWHNDLSLKHLACDIYQDNN